MCTKAIDYWYRKYLADHERMQELEKIILTAEDHAYFAGNENMREKSIECLENVLEYYVGLTPISEDILRKFKEEINKL